MLKSTFSFLPLLFVGTLYLQTSLFRTKDMIATIKSLCGDVKSNSSFTLSEGVLGAAAVLSSLGVAYLIGSALLG